MKSDNKQDFCCKYMDEVEIEWFENQTLDEIDEKIKELIIRKKYLLRLFNREK
ncbi:MAG: hypothetical protein IT284_01100 [Bacteroidetes bacterium]|nr:hypothetical protein [Bacteroidota bacterium]